jgi:hypothetical protein
MMQHSVEFMELLTQIRKLDDASIRGDVSRQFLEIQTSPDQSEVTLNGNCEGLVHFARLVLDVAGRNFEGAHAHFDASGELDRCDLPLIVSLKAAAWDLK